MATELSHPPSYIGAVPDHKGLDLANGDYGTVRGHSMARDEEDCSTELDALTETKGDSNVKLITKDLKAMGLAAGGKLGSFQSSRFPTN
jgi:hypothetical protein